MNGSAFDEPSFTINGGNGFDSTSCACNSVIPEEIPPPKIYKRRWYILFCFSMMCMCFGLAVSVLNPIANALKKAYGWNNAEVALLNTWSPLGLVLASTFFSWLLDTKGLRTFVVCSTSLLALGTGVRCLPAINPSLHWCIHIGAIFIGLSSTLAYAGCTTVSKNWFPPHQRILATSLANVGLTIGVGVGSIASPILVPLKENASSIMPNDTTIDYSSSLGISTTDEQEVLVLRGDILIVLFIVFGLATVIWIASIIYFPSKPPTSPSITASSERIDFYGGFKNIIKKPKFWIITTILALSIGITSGLGAVLDVNLEAAQVPGDQIVSGSLISGALICSLFISLGISIFIDKYREHAKNILLLLSIIALAAFLWFALILQGLAPKNYASLYISFITAQAVVLAPLPVYLELACDAVYPIAEGITTGFANIPLSLALCLFLYVFFIPNVGTLWMNWLTVGAVGACIPLLIIFKPSSGRLQIDDSPYTTGDRKQLVSPSNYSNHI